MATALVGGAFLSGFVNVLFDRLSSPEVVDLIRGKKLGHNLLQRLETTLYAVQAVLNDAEYKHIRDPSVKRWLHDLKDALYVADDLLDDVSTKAATQLEVTNFFSRFLNSHEREMVSKLEDIVDRLESILKLKDSLGLQEIEREKFSSWRAPSSSLDVGSKIHGRDKDKEAILKLLLDDDAVRESDGNISVIPIVGMGGVGKTTLAQLVYNDPSLKDKFDVPAWVCVSDEFDMLRVTKTIREAVTRSTCNLNDINLLHLDLKDKLTGKKFLIVLDDVWIEDYVNWNLLKKPFQYGASGSKILVTTRNEKVASVVQTCPTYHLNQLSNEDCWLVFADHACFPLESNNENKALEEIGKKIVKKCEGLPLAAQSLGGMLRAKHDIMNWNSILNSDIWDLSEDESKIIPALRISYHYLPPHLKRCFVYCSLYPKDYQIDKEELILLWMAEDLLPPPKKGKTIKEVGYEYIDDLTSRSFFQKSRYGSGCFVMHDLMHDLATFLGEEFYCRVDELHKETKINVKARHLSFSMLSDPISDQFEVFKRVKFLRTFLPINDWDVPFNIRKAPYVILSKWRYLRVLSFRSFGNIDVLPDSIGEMIHLRYLDLSWTSIKGLPDSLGKLHNLQTLNLSLCFGLTTLPNSMQNLVNLMDLSISKTNLEEMPRRMDKLKQMQQLDCFIVGKHEENGIKQLGELVNLHGSLHIKKLENVADNNEALEARMMDKEHIKELTLEWSDDYNGKGSQTETNILCMLQPHHNLEVLVLHGYMGTTFPDWVGHSSYRNMTKLSLVGCKNCWTLPSLGQMPSLKVLEFKSLNGLIIIGTDFYKNDKSCSGTPFPSLESLSFDDMPCWEEWHSFESDAFPRLCNLTIGNCPRLKGDLPTHLPALQRLNIENCEQLASSPPRAPAIRELMMSKSNKVGLCLQELPLSLEYLVIGEGCKMEDLAKARLTCLRNLSISGCSSAILFPWESLPTSLVNLEIRNCRKLEFPEQYQHQQLKYLTIVCSCDSLTSFHLEAFPNLMSLTTDCENMESLLVSQSQDADPHPLNALELFHCPKLKSLSPQLISLVPKLQYLNINNCKDIEWYPEEGMLPNLTNIDIVNCEKLLSGFASMEALTNVSIHGPLESVKSFPKEGSWPVSLCTLLLTNLTSLETLDCKGLFHLTSLKRLEVFYCPKLHTIVGERLPTSLSILRIGQCPLLEERCQIKHPQIWPKISHIRGIQVHARWIS